MPSVLLGVGQVSIYREDDDAPPNHGYSSRSTCPTTTPTTPTLGPSASTSADARHWPSGGS